MGKAPKILILQGPLSTFYSDIAEALTRQGATFTKIHICGNDVMDWHQGGAVLYQDTLVAWPDFLEKEFGGKGYTHILMHGDRRPYHKAAMAWAARHDVDVVVTELGYLRPDWMTLERGAVSAGSHFPNDPEIIRQIADKVDEYDPHVRFPGKAHMLVTQELRFTFFNMLKRRQFPNYVTHRSDHPLPLYAGWIKQQVKKRLTKAAVNFDDSKLFYVFALQLNSDYQLRDHSPYRSLYEAVEQVIASFAQHADPEAHLVLKPHPLDFAQTRLVETIKSAEDKHSLAGRLTVVTDVPIAELCEKTAGFVTVNSSAGMEALSVGCPTFSIMPTIYDVDGLTFQGQLDEFWQNGNGPDAALFQALCKALAGTIQIRGTLYNDEGRKAAARGVAARIVADNVNEPDAYVVPPPRLKKAALMGVTYD